MFEPPRAIRTAKKMQVKGRAAFAARRALALAVAQAGFEKGSWF